MSNYPNIPTSELFQEIRSRFNEALIFFNEIEQGIVAAERAIERCEVKRNLDSKAMRIIQVVSDATNVGFKDIAGRSKVVKIVAARQLCHALAVQLGMNNSEAGRAFDCQPSTISHSVKKVAKATAISPILKRTIDRCLECLRT